MMAFYGARFAAYVLEPAGPWASALAVDASLDEIENRISTVKRQLREIRRASD